MLCRQVMDATALAGMALDPTGVLMIDLFSNRADH
jgi:hypothetical protein